MVGDDTDQFLSSVHGQIPCTICHEGDDEATTKAAAHTGLISRPSQRATDTCGYCHTQVVHSLSSLHKNLWGEKSLIAKRAGYDDFNDVPEHVKAGFNRDCASCHATCGDCHVSRPLSVGGGLVNGHRFATPDMTENCTACHGSRVGMEYRGENEGVGADVHFVPGAMRCQQCHTAVEMHGDGQRYDHRLEMPATPMCEDCHTDIADANVYHQEHVPDFSCQTCHSQDYKSCNTCHAGSGLAEPSYLTFKIGRNPVPELRSYDYVLLRHVPIAPDTYADWGLPDLPDYATEPTWKYAAPHNIRRWTDRTRVAEGEPCGEACHNSPDGPDGVFLRQADLDLLSPLEASANEGLIVPNGRPETW